MRKSKRKRTTRNYKGTLQIEIQRTINIRNLKEKYNSKLKETLQLEIERKPTSKEQIKFEQKGNLEYEIKMVSRNRKLKEYNKLVNENSW